MVNQRTTLTNAFETTLTAQLDGTSLSMTVADATGLDDTYDFYLVIDPDSATKREYVECNDVTASVITIATGRRYLAGSAQGSGITHDSGAVVRMVPLAQHIEDLNDRVDTLGDHGGLTGLTDDDHTQYTKKATLTAKGSIYGASAASAPAELAVGTNGQVLSADSGEATGLKWTDASPSDHGGLTGLDDDDHTQYHTDARAATWHGGLSGGHVTNDNSHDHSGGDGAQIDHGGLGGLTDDDHTQYLKTGFVSFGVKGSLTQGAGTQRWHAPFDLSIQRVTLALGTASSSGNVEVDVNRNGTTIFTTQSKRPICVATDQFDASDTPDVQAMTKDTHYLTIDWDAIGTGAADATVTVEFVRT